MLVVGRLMVSDPVPVIWSVTRSWPLLVPVMVVGAARSQVLDAPLSGPMYRSPGPLSVRVAFVPAIWSGPVSCTPNGLLPDDELLTVIDRATNGVATSLLAT